MRALHTTLIDRLGISAASGLARLGGRFFVVADDELALYELNLAPGAPARALPLFAGELPVEAAARKAAKPDLEALTVLPAAIAGGEPRLLAIPSGSRPTRGHGALVSGGEVRIVDFTRFFAALRGDVLDLNIEGAAVVGDRLVFLQRGNGKAALNALIAVDAAAATRIILEDAALPASLPWTITPVALGKLGGVALGFTDATPLSDDRFLFAAAAEATDDPYLDGACTGSIVGFCSLDGRLGDTFALAGELKVEGLHAEHEGSGELALFLVTDADDRRQAAGLYHARIKARPSRTRR